MNKSLNDIEDLLKIIESEEKIQPKKRKTRKENPLVLAFMRDSEIGPGDNRVPNFVIYYQFRKWLNAGYRKRIGKTEFFRTFSKKCDAVRSGSQRCYMVNDKVDTSDEFVRLAKLYMQRDKKSD